MFSLLFLPASLIIIDYFQIEAGGELIVTQLFYDVDIFFKFVKDCRSAGISVPILPGGLNMSLGPYELTPL